MRLTLEEAAQLRFLECPAYSGCLNFAAHVNWSGFHCVRCSAYQRHHAALAEKYGTAPPVFDELVLIASATKQP